MYLTPTSYHLANEYEGWERIVERMASVGPQNLRISAATVFEFTRMQERRRVKKRVIEASLALLEPITVIPINAQIAALGGNLQGQLMNRGKSVSEADAMIAATAMWREFVLVSDDRDFLEIPGLDIQNWVRES